MYRSDDGGRNWEVVFSGFSAVEQLVHAADGTQGRSIFLLTNIGDQTGISERTLYRSNDSGLIWQRFELPPGIEPITLAISPSFAQDGLLFVGTVDGQVVALSGNS